MIPFSLETERVFVIVALDCSIVGFVCWDSEDTNNDNPVESETVSITFGIINYKLSNYNMYFTCTVVSFSISLIVSIESVPFDGSPPVIRYAGRVALN